MTVNELLSRLKGVKKTGDGWIALCPAHDDRRPSLSVSVGDSGDILVFCFAGCRANAICKALGSQLSDLRAGSGGNNGHAKPGPRSSAAPTPNFAAIATRYELALVDELAADEAVRLGVSVEALRQLRAGWDSERGALTISERDADGRVIGINFRRADGSRTHRGKRGIIAPEAIDPDATLYVCEGGTDALAALSLGLNAIGRPSCSVGIDMVRSFAKRRGVTQAIVVADADAPGRRGAQQLANALAADGVTVKIVEPVSPHKDLRGWVQAGATREAMMRLANDASPAPDAADDAPSAEGDGGAKRIGPSTATVLVELAQRAELFHNANGDAFTTIPRSGHRETWPIRSRGFRSWLLALYYAKRKSAPGAQTVQDALSTIEARAIHEGPEIQTHIRRAEHDGAIYIDLCDAEYRNVKVTADGWEVQPESPIKFIRRPGMMPLPVPERGGSIAQLRRFVNIPDDSDFVLAVAWLVGAARPRGPYPVLVVNGEQGGAKSTACRVLRQLVDPSGADLASQPRDDRDLVIAASNSAVIGLDNLSGVPLWLSDALCRIATGGGFRTRELYTNADEIILSVQRPIFVNGIEELVTRSDLLDRAIRVILPTIDEKNYRSESDFWCEYEAARPAMFGALLDALATALRNLDRVQLKTSTRMADFARFVAAAEPSLPWRPGTFIEAYARNRCSAHELAIEASPVASVLQTWFEGIPSGTWTGTATELLAEIEATLPTRDGRPIKPKGWPKQSNRLSGQLARLAPNLRAVGIHVIRDRDDSRARHRQLTIRKVPSAIVQDRPIVQEPVSGAPRGDLFGRSPDDTPRVSDDQIALDRTVADDSDDPSPTSSGADRDGSGFADSFGGWADIDDNPNATAWADA